MAILEKLKSIANVIQVDKQNAQRIARFLEKDNGNRKGAWCVVPSKSSIHHVEAFEFCYGPLSED